MSLRTVASGFPSSFAAFLAAAELALFAAQSSLTLAVVPGVRNGVALGISQEDLQAHLQANVWMWA